MERPGVKRATGGEAADHGELWALWLRYEVPVNVC